MKIIALTAMLMIFMLVVTESLAQPIEDPQTEIENLAQQIEDPQTEIAELMMIFMLVVTESLAQPIEDPQTEIEDISAFIRFGCTRRCRWSDVRGYCIRPGRGRCLMNNVPGSDSGK
eukprot:GFUD01034660.1.p1 GENE.GFUD01034660.1~~GFUD01034660.1.p1  ORF type:complete len:117 (+),score=18.89 GFUD01034660.1:38-388(+)